jgi:2-polyprenyl-6-methoxyphenol hydroxylase-like FAD-dependent oxidoreductase
MSSPDWPGEGILIVGGGIAGLALACALKRRGIECQIVERASTWAPVGAGIILGVNAMAVMRELGLAESLEAKGVVLDAMKITDAQSQPLMATNLDALRPRFGVSIALHRAALQDSLLAGAEGVPIRMGTTLESASHREGRMIARLSDGDERAFGLVVGADGLHSRTRELAFGARRPRYSGYSCWRMVIHGVELEFGAQEMWGIAKRFGLVRLGEGRVYCFAVVNAPPGEPDPAESRIQRLRNRFAEFEGPVPELLDQLQEPSELIQNDLYEITDRPWYRDGWVLVGDAAHGMLPDMGQGAAMALEDVAVLAELIGNGLPRSEVLSQWARRRQGRVRWVQNQSRRIGRIGQWSNPLACGIRNRVAKNIPDAWTTGVLARLAGRPI